MKAILFLVLFCVVSCGTDKNDERTVMGEPGPQGQRGAEGAKGSPGESCTVEEVAGGVEIVCGNDTPVVLRHGIDGADGKDGKDGVDAILEIIDPCGPMGGPTYNDEVLLRLSARSLVAYFENGGKRYLASIGPGTYMTTDSQNCIFTVSEDLEVTW